MKNIILSLVTVLALAFSVTAQDTILMLGPKSNYLNNYWCFLQGDTVKEQGLGGKFANRFYNKDTVTVYGIAVFLRNLDYNGDKPVMFQLFKHTPTSFDPISEIIDLFATEPPTYYMQQDFVWYKNFLTIIDQPVFPIHERYFHHPVTVVDSFYVGYEPPQWPALIYGIGIGGFTWYDTRRGVSYPIPQMAYLWNGTTEYEWYYYHRSGDVLFLYPILTPPDTIISGTDSIMVGDTIVVCDTLIVDGDTIITYDTILSLPEAGLSGRLVGVMPNPAGETAKVVSSFGLTMVEAFSMAGERVCTLRLPDAPLTATLDVRRWPTDTYLLRIHTPQGVTTKKLTVRH